MPHADFGLRIRGNFSWGLNQPQESGLIDLINLKRLNFEVKKGEFVCVIGSVAQGKSSLVHAIAGNLINIPDNLCDQNLFEESAHAELKNFAKKFAVFEFLEAPVQVSGSLGFQTNSTWTSSKTIRETVLFGKTFDLVKYETIMTACLLSNYL